MPINRDLGLETAHRRVLRRLAIPASIIALTIGVSGCAESGAKSREGNPDVISKLKALGYNNITALENPSGYTGEIYGGILEQCLATVYFLDNGSVTIEALNPRGDLLTVIPQTSVDEATKKLVDTELCNIRSPNAPAATDDSST